MKLIFFSFLFALIVLAEMAFLPSFFSVVPPFLSIGAAVIMMAFMESRRRFGLAVLGGLTIDVLHSSAVFIYAPAFVSLAVFLWLWDMLVKLEEPVSAASRGVLGFLFWLVLWTLVIGQPFMEIQISSAAGSLTGGLDGVLKRDLVFWFALFAAAVAARFYVFRRQRQRSLSNL